MNKPKVNDKIYVESHYYISRGRDDVDGGLATVCNVDEGISGGEKCVFVEVKEHPGHSYNWSQHLAVIQDKLKTQYKSQVAKACPDIDTPFIEAGDIVNGKKYKGPPIW